MRLGRVDHATGTSTRGESWEERGACRGQDPRLWDESGGLDRVREGAAVCAACPVRAQCLRKAHTDPWPNSPDGAVWAGMFWIGGEPCPVDSTRVVRWFAGGALRAAQTRAAAAAQADDDLADRPDCPVCGKRVPHSRRVYCRPQCAGQAHAERSNARKRRDREARRARPGVA